MTSRVRVSSGCITATLAAALAGGCGHPVPPSGGPVDDTPPRVTGTSPRLYETDVARGRPLRIAFSERMDNGSVERGIRVRPSVDWGSRFWRADTLFLSPREGWAPETTYTILFRSSIRDGRRNGLGEPRVLTFATGPEIARGRVTGMVERIGVSEGDVLVLAFEAVTEDTTNVDPERAVSISEPDRGGRFVLAGLRIGAPYEIGAFFDVNENGVFDGGTDLYTRALSPVAPDSAGGPSGVSIALVFADEPGRIAGVVEDAACRALDALRRRRATRADSLERAADSLATARRALDVRADSLYGAAVAPERGGEAPARVRARADSLRAAARAIAPPDSSAWRVLAILPREARADSIRCAQPIVARFRAATDTSGTYEARPPSGGGAFTIGGVPPGRYTGTVFRDLTADGTYDAEDPGSGGLEVYVPPGREARADTVRLGAAKEDR